MFTKRLNWPGNGWRQNLRSATQNANSKNLPSRYVGMAPEEMDEDFDFEKTMRTIHAELQELNAESVELAEIKDGVMPVRE